MQSQANGLSGPVIAAIAAAVAAAMDSTPAGGWKIRSIRPVSTGVNPWSLAGRIQAMADRGWALSRRTRS